MRPVDPWSRMDVGPGYLGHIAGSTGSLPKLPLGYQSLRTVKSTEKGKSQRTPNETGKRVKKTAEEKEKG